MSFSQSKIKRFLYKALSFLFISFIKGTATSCLLLLSGIMETHRTVDIEDLDLQVFDSSMRQTIWTR